MAKAKFIVIDGLDGSGKDTQIELLKKRYEGNSVWFTREPGGTERAERIRQVVVDPKLLPPADSLTQMCLVFGARNDHLSSVREHLRQGTSTVSNRFDSSTFAYQIYGEERHDLEPLFDALRRRIVERVVPTAYVFVDVSPEVAVERVRRDAANKQSVFDQKPVEYYRRVREGFATFTRIFGHQSRMVWIDGEQSVERVQKDLAEVIERILKS